MAPWKERQDRIEELERTLAGLCSRVNQFAQSLSASQIALQNCVAVASKLKKGVSERRNVTTGDIVRSAHTIAPAASGARRSEQTFPWMPSIPQMQSGALVVEGGEVAVPTVAAHSVPLEPVQTKRTPVLPGETEGSSEEDDE
jgi:hypothetical protein